MFSHFRLGLLDVGPDPSRTWDQWDLHDLIIMLPQSSVEYKFHSVDNEWQHNACKLLGGLIITTALAFTLLSPLHSLELFLLSFLTLMHTYNTSNLECFSL